MVVDAAAVEDIYRALVGLEDAPREELHRSLRVRLPQVEALLPSVDALGRWPKEALEQAAELAVAALAVAPEASQHQMLGAVLQYASEILVVDSESSRAMLNALAESLVLSLDVLNPDEAGTALSFLARVVGSPEGVLREQGLPPGEDIPPTERAILRSLLHVGLYREVTAFLALRSQLRSVPAGPDHVEKPAISILSRKGGVGKSLIALSSCLAFIRRNRSNVACILDFDVTGPVWQYLLFPEPGMPSRFINEFLDLSQGDQEQEFDFPDGYAVRDIVHYCLEATQIPECDGRLKVISLADLPRTNRYLSTAFSNNSGRLFQFLSAMVCELHRVADLVVIDNSPGFGVIPLLSHALMCRLARGSSVVVSTPAQPDLRGTLIEMSDLRLLDVGKPPLWLINQATRESLEFLAQPQSVFSIAEELSSYNNIVPKRPVIGRAALVGSSTQGLSTAVMPRDPALSALGHTLGPERTVQHLVPELLGSHFFKVFEEQISARIIGPAAGEG